MELLKPLSKTDYPAKTIAYTDTAASTGTWAPGPQGVMIWATTDCYIEVGEGVTATTASTPIPANTPIPFAVPQGTGGRWKISAIRVATSGNMYAKPINIQ